MGLRSREFDTRVFVFTTLAAAALLVGIVAIPQWLSKQARLEVLRSHVSQIARLAAAAVDGDLHRQLIDPNNYTPALYEEALAPLVRFHSANPEIFYVYTMVELDGTAHFVLDTASSPNLRSPHKLRASNYMEVFRLRPEYESDWLERIAAGETWVNPTFQYDDYGNFLSAHAPIFDSEGRYSGFSGVDFDLEYYLNQEARFRAIGIGTFLTALVLAVLLGYLIARYHYVLQHRMQEHYRISIRDSLTGLLNRRGAMDVITKALARRPVCYALLLIDIDDLKAINDTHGHAAGDAVIACAAEAIRQSIRELDDCARLGGDEFMVFAPDCDTEGAAEIARRILVAAASHVHQGRCVALSVSIGVAVQSQPGADFDRMYRDADAALYHAKSQGKHCFAVFDPSMTAQWPARRLA